MINSLRRNWRSVFINVTIVMDALTILVSALLAFYLRQFFPNAPHLSDSLFATFAAYFGLVLIGTGMLNGLYRGAYHLSNRKQYLLAAKAYFYSVFIILSTFYILQIIDFPRRFTFLFFLTLPAVFTAGRSLINGFNIAMQRRGFGVHRVLLVGYDGTVEDVLERFEGIPELGYEIRGIVSKKRTNLKAVSPIDNHPIPYYPLGELDVVVKKDKVDRLFVPSPSLIMNGYADVLEVCRRRSVKLKVLSPEHDQLLNLARVYDIAGITLYAPPRIHVEALRQVAKRAFDVVCACVAILMLSPIFIATGIAILIESGPPVFFHQRRASVKGGRTFPFYKFRSMVKNADELKADLMKYNETDGALFKMKNDPRTTRVGRIIRKFSIDELPQLFNVLMGHMSLVGPRPLPVGDFEKVNEPDEFWRSIRDREKTKPGMTGLWQISGRSNIGFREMVLLDLYYVENHSILFDIEILFATIPVVLFGKDAY